MSTSDADHSRESARRNDGRFGEQHRGESPAPDLPPTRNRDGLNTAQQAVLNHMRSRSMDYDDLATFPSVLCDNTQARANAVEAVVRAIGATHPSGYHPRFATASNNNGEVTVYKLGLRGLKPNGASHPVGQRMAKLEQSYQWPETGMPVDGQDAFIRTWQAMSAQYEELVGKAQEQGLTAPPPLNEDQADAAQHAQRVTDHNLLTDLEGIGLRS